MNKILITLMCATWIFTLNGVLVKNEETGMIFRVTGKGETVSIPDNEEAIVYLKNGSSFTAESGNRNYRFNLTATEDDIASIVLKYDSNHKIYAEVNGKPGKQDYKEFPVNGR